MYNIPIHMLGHSHVHNFCSNLHENPYFQNSKSRAVSILLITTLPAYIRSWIILDG